MLRPPCWPDGQPPPNNCAAALYNRTVNGITPLYAEWSGWRLSGRWLVSPEGDRITPERLRGILWREQLRTRRLRAGQQEELSARPSGRRMQPPVRPLLPP